MQGIIPFFINFKVKAGKLKIRYIIRLGGSPHFFLPQVPPALDKGVPFGKLEKLIVGQNSIIQLMGALSSVSFRWANHKLFALVRSWPNGFV